MELLEEIAKLSAFNYVIKTSNDGTYGRIHHVTGEWRGIIGDLIHGVSLLLLFEPRRQKTNLVTCAPSEE